MTNDYHRSMIPTAVKMYREYGDPEMLHMLLNYIEGVDIPCWFTGVTLARNEDGFCPGCGQDTSLHPDNMPPGPDCQLSKGEDGLDPDDYRQERHDDTWEQYEDDHNVV